MDFSTILDNMQEKAAKVAPIDAKLKFDFDGDIIHIDGTDGSNTISNEDKDADCVISMSKANFQKLLSGDLNPMMAVMTGKIKIKGDMGLAMKLQSLLK